MANEVPVMPPQAVERLTLQMARLEFATLAAAMITASGRPHSVQEAHDLMLDLQYSSHPNPGSGAYKEWQRTSAARLKLPHK